MQTLFRPCSVSIGLIKVLHNPERRIFVLFIAVTAQCCLGCHIYQVASQDRGSHTVYGLFKRCHLWLARSLHRVLDWRGTYSSTQCWLWISPDASRVEDIYGRYGTTKAPSSIESRYLETSNCILSVLTVQLIPQCRCLTNLAIIPFPKFLGYSTN